MGSGMCRAAGGKSRTSPGVDGLYRKIVFNYAKQDGSDDDPDNPATFMWTRSTDKYSNNRGEKNMKHKIRRQKEKLIISGPFPADPDRLEGDKWRYVILTQLDTEPPPERPPRSKRRRPHQQHRPDPTSGCGHWGSVRRRSFCRGSGRRRPPRLGRPDTDIHDQPSQGAERKRLASWHAVQMFPVSNTVTVKYSRQNGFFESVDGIMAIVDNMF